jgi:hypothetical protein
LLLDVTILYVSGRVVSDRWLGQTVELVLLRIMLRPKTKVNTG